MVSILSAVQAATPLRSLNNPSSPIYRALVDALDGAPTTSGQNVSEDRALRIVTVYAAVSFISQTIAALPRRIVRKDDDQQRVIRNPAHRAIWGRPNPEQTWMEFLEQAIASCLLWGNTYIAIFRDGGANIAQLWVLDPARVRVGRPTTGSLAGRKVFFVDGVPYTDREILHVPALSRPGRLVGLSPIQQARESLGIALAAEEFAGRFYGQGTLIAGYLSVPGELDDTQADRLMQRWRRQYSGTSSAYRVAVLDNAASFQNIGIPPADAEFLETRKYHDRRIAALYRIAPHLVSDVDSSTSWGSGIAEQGQTTVVHTLRPWIVRFEQRFETLLGENLRLRIVVDGLLRGTMQQRFQSYAVGRQWGWLTVNDVLRFEDMPTIGREGDVYLAPLNMVPLTTLLGTTPDERRAAQSVLYDARVRAAAQLARNGVALEDATVSTGLDPVYDADVVAREVESARGE